jgi:hypothetical protein
MRKNLLFVLAILSVMLVALPLAAQGSTKTVVVEIAGHDVAITTPETYPSCEATSDAIQITGLDPSWYLRGQIIVDFVDNGGRINYSVDPVKVTGSSNYSFVVDYPAIADWLTPEIHVDAQLEVFDSDPDAGQAILLGTLGPGSDWDIFCFEPPTETPPPPPPPPPGTEGCTPGYWKNHLKAWGATGYALGDDFDATFGVDLFDPNITLETAMNLGGGGVNRLARHGVAALLSAAHPDVDSPYTVAEVIALVQAGDADALADANELGCPL